MTSWRTLADGRVAVELSLAAPTGECESIDVVAVGADMQAVLMSLRAAGLSGVRRPERGNFPDDAAVEEWDRRQEPYIWRPGRAEVPTWHVPATLSEGVAAHLVKEGTPRDR